MKCCTDGQSSHKAMRLNQQISNTSQATSGAVPGTTRKYCKNLVMQLYKSMILRKTKNAIKWQQVQGSEMEDGQGYGKQVLSEKVEGPGFAQPGEEKNEELGGHNATLQAVEELSHRRKRLAF